MKKGGNILDDFEIIYKKYYKYVKQYVVSLCFDEILAEEIAQEAFLKALENYNSFKGDCLIETWICRIAHNIFISIKRKRKEENIDNYTALASNINIYSSGEDRETATRIFKILMSLTTPYKDVFYMRAVGEMPFEVIAELFQKTPSWARVTYYRAKKEIIERLGENNE